MGLLSGYIFRFKGTCAHQITEGGGGSYKWQFRVSDSFGLTPRQNKRC